MIILERILFSRVMSRVVVTERNAIQILGGKRKESPFEALPYKSIRNSIQLLSFRIEYCYFIRRTLENVYCLTCFYTLRQFYRTRKYMNVFTVQPESSIPIYNLSSPLQLLQAVVQPHLLSNLTVFIPLYSLDNSPMLRRMSNPLSVNIERNPQNKNSSRNTGH